MELEGRHIDSFLFSLRSSSATLRVGEQCSTVLAMCKYSNIALEVFLREFEARIEEDEMNMVCTSSAYLLSTCFEQRILMVARFH